MDVQHPFAPVVDSACQVLILGSFPSVKSRENEFYYGHPQNRFWPLMAALLAEPVPHTIPEKQALLLKHHIALWDVIAACEITGSADATVKNPAPVDIERVTACAPIRRILCNGALAGKLYQRYLQPLTGIAPVILPSTSPANAAWSLERLKTVWQKHL